MAIVHQTPTSPWRHSHGGLLILSVAGMIGGWTLSASAQAGMSCQDGVKGMTEKRQAAVASLNDLAKAGKGKLDPAAACPRLRNLVAIEASLSAYLVKNKEWCSIPDEVINNLAASRVKTQQFAAKACDVAAQIVRAKKEAASQAAAAAAQELARLPAGPL